MISPPITLYIIYITTLFRTIALLFLKGGCGFGYGFAPLFLKVEVDVDVVLVSSFASHIS